MNESRGVLYQATGHKRYLASCACSVQSLRWSGYRGAIRVLVDEHDIPENLFRGLDVELHFVPEMKEGRISARAIKTRLHEYSNYEKTLFLDSDIVVLNDINHVWQEINEADLAMARCLLPVEQTLHGCKEEVSYMNEQGIAGLQWNSGVMLWQRNDVTRSLFEIWYQEWQRFGHIDQLALVRALLKSPVSFHELPQRYNYLRPGPTLQLQGDGVVFHHLGGGREAKEFAVIFGEIYNAHCQVLQLQKQDMTSPYHAALERNLRAWRASSWAKQKCRGVRRRCLKLLSRH